jgi:hypothetical protein
MICIQVKALKQIGKQESSHIHSLMAFIGQPEVACNCRNLNAAETQSVTKTNALPSSKSAKTIGRLHTPLPS